MSPLVPCTPYQSIMHAVDAGELHQQQVVFDDVRVAGGVRPDLGIVVRCDLPLARWRRRYSDLRLLNFQW